MKRVSIIVLASILMSPLCFSQEPGPSSERLTLKDEYVLLVKDLANMGTYGYRCHLSERDNMGRAAPQQYQGALEATGSSTDIAINGKGFFRIALENGRFAYTRNGRMGKSPDGELVLPGGYGTGISIPASGASILIGRDGTVKSLGNDGSAQTTGKIALYDLAADSVTETEAGVYEAASASEMPDDQICIVQGCLEQSTVDGIKTILRLLFLLESDTADTIPFRGYKTTLLNSLLEYAVEAGHDDDKTGSLLEMANDMVPFLEYDYGM